uniref:CC domain-containing protein n=1 Tax=Bursaphelenchus xylophilus TaxID=6326 RepID=A0A1I7SBJ1_BURXY
MEPKLYKHALLLGLVLLLHAFSLYHAAEHEQKKSLLADAVDHQLHDDPTPGNSTRVKRQFGCPSGCYSSCMNNAQCQRYQVATVCMLGCCCPQTNLSSACDGDPAVAACLNGLCGQGYFCNNKNFCCRCQSGTSPGPCVNNLCPAGYACNTNNYCCSLGSGSVLGPGVNGRCPDGYACGAGNLCYPVTATDGRGR